MQLYGMFLFGMLGGAECRMYPFQVRGLLFWCHRKVITTSFYFLTELSLPTLLVVKNREQEENDSQTLKWRWFAGLCVLWDPVKALMSLLLLDHEVWWSGRDMSMVLGQQGHRTATQTSHLLNQSMSSSMGTRQVGSLGPALAEFRMIIRGEELLRARGPKVLSKQKCWACI